MTRRSVEENTDIIIEGLTRMQNEIDAARRPMPDGAVIEIVERTDSPDPHVIVPNEVRINGQRLLCPDDHPIRVHEMSVGSDVVLVTLTVFARRVVIGAEPDSDTVIRDAAGKVVRVLKDR